MTDSDVRLFIENIILIRAWNIVQYTPNASRKKPYSDKHCSLLKDIINYVRKKFNITGQWNFIHGIFDRLIDQFWIQSDNISSEW